MIPLTQVVPGLSACLISRLWSFKAPNLDPRVARFSTGILFLPLFAERYSHVFVIPNFSHSL